MQKPVNSSLVFDVLANHGLKVEIGGGIRNMETIAFYLEQGVSVSFWVLWLFAILSLKKKQ